MLLGKEDVAHDGCDQALGILALCSDKPFFCPAVAIKNILIDFKTIQVDPALGSKIEENTSVPFYDLLELVLRVKDQNVIAGPNQSLQDLRDLDVKGLSGTGMADDDPVGIHQELPVA